MRTGHIYKGFVNPNTGRLNKYCLDCGKKLSRLGHKICKKCEGKHISVKQIGANNPNWNGGRIYMGKYILVRFPEHPASSTHRGYILEHRLVIEKHLGRYLNPDEVVHHINGIKDDNRIENLKLLSVAEHSYGHKDFTTGKFVREENICV